VLEAAADAVRSATRAEVLPIVADVARRGEPERFVAETLARFGRIDVLVNNAGREAIGPFSASDDDAWQADLELKLFGAIRTIRGRCPR
jgi:NAD(P)-dependent dehydrogenase (short-subunit alcohol dehydrogenase family)